MKVKKWKELYESPDLVEWRENGKVEKLYLDEQNSVSFTLDNEGKKAIVSFGTDGDHNRMQYEYNKRNLPTPMGSAISDFSGRLWLAPYKIISFWNTPKDEKKLQKYLEDLDQDLRDKGHLKPNETIFNSGWRVEDYRDSDNMNGAGKMNKTNDINEPIPLEEFTYQEFDPEAYKVHLMNFKEKEQYYKKYGKPKGFGSDLKSKKNPIWWEQAKRTSENLIITFEKFNNRDDR